MNKSFKIKIIGLLFILMCFEKTFALGPHNEVIPKISVVGDSYAGHFSMNKGTEKYDYFIFPVGTINNEYNEKVFEDAINADNRYILFATGVNDQALNTDPVVFENVLRKYISEIIAKGKYLFLHTYMEYINKKIENGAYEPDVYDEIYKKLANEYENVFYIDMSGYNNKQHDFGDGLHFDKFFYDSLEAKLVFYVASVERMAGFLKSPGTMYKNRKQLALVGDFLAYDFFSFENKKKYEMYDFTSKGLNLNGCRSYFMNAIDTDVQVIFLSSGDRDFKEQTNVNEYKDTLREYFNVSCMNNKRIFVISSVNYNDKTALNISLSEYDMALEDIANEYPNTCYINLRNYEKNNLTFYDNLYTLIDVLISNIY